MKRVKKNSRHIRWNWEQSPDNPELVRYHFIDVDDKNREGIMRKIIEQLTKYGFVEKSRQSLKGKVKGSKFRYLFESYDSDQKPSMLDLSKLGKFIKRDYDLYERKVGNLEDYVIGLYE